MHRSMRPQAAARGFAARRQVAALRLQRKQDAAAVTIQAWWKACLVQQHLHQQRCAAVVIQAHWRRAQAQARLQRQRQAAVILQAHWR